MNTTSGNYFRCFTLPALLLLFIAMVAQTERHAIHLGVDEGLSQGSVFDIDQDDHGFMWIATADGLNRFDGYNFTLYENNSADSGTHPFKRLRNLFRTPDAMWVAAWQTMFLWRIDLISGKVEQVYDFEEQDGYSDVAPFLLSGDTLWNLVTNAGVVALSVSQKKIIHTFPEAGNPFPANNLVQYDSSTRTVWYGNVRYAELYSFSLDSKRVTRKAFVQPNTTDTSRVFCIRRKADGTFIIGTQGAVIAYDPVNDSSRVFALPVKPEDVGAISALFIEDNETVWCGTYDGYIFRLNTRTGSIVLKSDPELTVNGVGHRIVTFHLDHSRNLWVGTDPVGLLRFDLKQKAFNHTWYDGKTDENLNSNFIKCFLQRGNEMLIGTYDHGINVLNMQTGTFSHINVFGNEHSAVVHDMTKDPDQRIWVATENGVGVIEPGTNELQRPQAEGYSNMLLRMGKTIHRTLDGTIVVGATYGVFAIERDGEKLRVDSINLKANVECFHTDRSGALWMGTVDGIYYSRNSDPHALKLTIPGTGLVKCFWEKDDGSLWIGTDHGLCLIDKQTNTIAARYTESDGMPNSFVYGVLGDGEGNLWLSTNKGLSRFDPAKKTFRNYSVTDGLQSNEFNTKAFCRAADGELYFGGVNGYNHFYPSSVADNPFTPECVITGFKLFDKPYATDTSIEYKSHITLDYTNNNLLLEYTAIEYSDPERNAFRYRLLGLDSNWVEAGDARFARFVNLDPGDYTFQVKAANNDGVWNESPRELRITITPPFWQTLWFIVTSSVIGLLLIALTIRYYFRRQVRTQTREFSLRQSARMNAIIETEERERKRIAEELHDGLGQLLSTARLNISGVEAELPDKDKVLWKNSLDLLDEACSEVRSISHNMMPGALIRSGLIEAVNDLANKITDSGKIVAEFDSDVEERFNENVEIAVYRIVQEILNNMLRHSGADRITISIHREQDKLKLVIADNGRSFDVRTIGTSAGIGWKNIYSRVEILNGEIDVKSEEGKGTSVHLSVSLV